LIFSTKIKNFCKKYQKKQKILRAFFFAKKKTHQFSLATLALILAKVAL
jgi:hypothetical protein